MKNKFRILSLSVITISGLLFSNTSLAMTSNVHAADNTVTVANKKLSFVYNGQNIADNSVVPLAQGVSVQDGESLEQVLSNAKKVVSLNLGSAKISTNVSEIMGQLQAQNVLIRLREGYIIDKVPAMGFYITLTAQEGNQTAKVRVPFGNAYTTTVNAPEIYATYDKNKQANVNGLVFQISAGTNFNPLDFAESNGERVKLSATKSGKLSVKSNTVDPSQAGSMGEVVIATDANNQETRATFRVLVKPEGMQRLGVATWTDSYRISDQKAWPGEQLNRGDIVYVGNDTQIIDGISYTRISTNSQVEANDSHNNLWIKTVDLAHESVDTFTKKVMHQALIYDSVGGSKYRKIAAFKSVTFEKKSFLIKGVKYYKVANAPDYIKASNIDGTKRTLKHNAYVYATSKRRADYTVLRKGTTITTYGGSYKFKNGKRYYRVAGATATNKRYVKVVNFE